MSFPTRPDGGVRVAHHPPNLFQATFLIWCARFLETCQDQRVSSGVFLSELGEIPNPTARPMGFAARPGRARLIQFPARPGPRAKSKNPRPGSWAGGGDQILRDGLRWMLKKGLLGRNFSGRPKPARRPMGRWVGPGRPKEVGPARPRADGPGRPTLILLHFGVYSAHMYHDKKCTHLLDLRAWINLSTYQSKLFRKCEESPSLSIHWTN